MTVSPIRRRRQLPCPERIRMSHSAPGDNGDRPCSAPRRWLGHNQYDGRQCSWESRGFWHGSVRLTDWLRSEPAISMGISNVRGVGDHCSMERSSGTTSGSGRREGRPSLRTSRCCATPVTRWPTGFGRDDGSGAFRCRGIHRCAHCGTSEGCVVRGEAKRSVARGETLAKSSRPRAWTKDVGTTRPRCNRLRGLPASMGYI
jgi:hypothetical protein